MLPAMSVGACAIPDNAYGRTTQYAVGHHSAGTVTGGKPLYTVISLGALISILPLVLAFIFLGRYWRGGLTVGATKG